MISYGPKIPVCESLHAMKYRLPNESFEESKAREAAAMGDNDEHRKQYKDIILDQRFMAAGRVQAAMGSPRNVTAYNCFVSGLIEDSMDSIMQRFALVVIGLCLLIALPAVLYHSCTYMMQYVAQFFRRDTEEGQ